MKKTFSPFLSILSGALCLAILLFALRSGKEPDAFAAMSGFCEDFGRAATVYAKSAGEGERGYCDPSFFPALFGEEPALIEDYAIAFFPSVEAPGECGLLVCRTRTEARRMAKVCRRRLDLLSSFSYGEGDRYPDEGFVVRRGKCVIYGVTEDAERAEKLLSRKLHTA